MFHVVLEVTFKDTSTFEYDFSLAFFLALDPVTLISCIINYIFAYSMSEPIFDLSFIVAAIWPFVVSFACDAIISELSRIHYTVSPCEGTLPIEKSIKKVSVVSVTIFEGDFPRSIETFSIDLAIL
jgi:hypothetical protein